MSDRFILTIHQLRKPEMGCPMTSPTQGNQPLQTLYPRLEILPSLVNIGFSDTGSDLAGQQCRANRKAEGDRPGA
jgi:hypothetical protein